MRRFLYFYFLIALSVNDALAKLDLPPGYESDMQEGIDTVNKAAEVFKGVLSGTLAALIIISCVFAILLRAIPSREWKEKGKAILFDNLGTILLALIGLPLLMTVLKLIKL
ncbi:MAG: hypothetical protein P8104_02160 [Gammaproteobacteria bacterium]